MPPLSPLRLLRTSSSPPRRLPSPGSDSQKKFRVTLGGEERVLTNRGYVEVSKLSKTGEFLAWSGSTWVLAEAFPRLKPRPRYVVRLSNGREIVCSSDQTWAVLNTKGLQMMACRTCDLSHGDEVFPYNLPSFSTFRRIVSDEDGFPSGLESLLVNPSPKEILKHFVKRSQRSSGYLSGNAKEIDELMLASELAGISSSYAFAEGNTHFLYLPRSSVDKFKEAVPGWNPEASRFFLDSVPRVQVESVSRKSTRGPMYRVVLKGGSSCPPRTVVVSSALLLVSNLTRDAAYEGGSSEESSGGSDVLSPPRAGGAGLARPVPAVRFTIV